MSNAGADTQVLIVGAGPTGLVLALWLTKLGVRLRIIDKNSGPAAFSRALGVHARTLEFYRQIGIADEVGRGGVKTQAANFWVNGRKAARLPLGKLGQGLTPYPFILGFAQDAHERLLIAQLEGAGVRVQRERELVGFEQQDGGVRAMVRRADGGEEFCWARYIAGCDGAHSTVRETLGIGFSGGTYSKLFYVADVQAAGPAVNGEVHVDLSAEDLLAVFAMKGSGRVRLVGTVREDRAANGDRELTFADVSGRAMSQLQVAVSKVNWFSTYRVHHRVADSFCKGRAFLLGDAAHVHSPVGAQGMNTGIGDAVNLAWKLAAVLQGRAAERLLKTYEPERIAFARRLVATTDRVFTFASGRGAVAGTLRTTLIPLLAPLVSKAPRIRRLLFRTVSQLALHYRGSMLSQGVAGSLRGGDRLPWVPPVAGEDNFAPLRSLEWQVHVYGEPRRGVAEACVRLRVPLHVMAWKQEMGRAGLRRRAAYLIRPDGYIALACARDDAERLRRYWNEHGLRGGGVVDG